MIGFMVGLGILGLATVVVARLYYYCWRLHVWSIVIEVLDLHFSLDLIEVHC